MGSRAPGGPARPDLDGSVPALLFKIGHYPLHHGTVGAVRSLGRAGVPVHAVVEDRLTPAALSRHLHGAHVWPCSGLEDPADLVSGLLRIGRRLGGRTVLVPTDDEAAVLAASWRGRLAECFLLPPVRPGLPGLLAGKRGLHDTCVALGVPTARSLFPRDLGQLLAAGAALGFPLVAKNIAPWERLRAPVVRGTTVIGDRAALCALLPGARRGGLMLQEYLPGDSAQDWIVHLYARADGGCGPVFTGLKMRSWPPGAGVTTYARALRNPGLARLSATLCARLGYRGIADLDWRLDLRDGRYKLVDFNPRPGAQFRLFETEHGIDVVRALHLDLTGRPIPSGRQREGRRFVVEHLDLPAFTAYRARPPGGARVPCRPVAAPGRGGIEPAWLSPDDPLPAVVTAARALGPATGLLLRRLRDRGRGR